MKIVSHFAHTFTVAAGFFLIKRVTFTTTVIPIVYLYAPMSLHKPEVYTSLRRNMHYAQQIKECFVHCFVWASETER